MLETETARLRLKGAMQAGSNFEYQSSAEGSESAVPLVLEYGVTDRLEVTLEPVFGTRIRPNTGPQASGAGDLELTTTFLAHREGTWPAIAFAGEVKFPTAKNTLIGTGQTDLAGFVIASKRFGRVDTHLNLSYTFVGQPAGTSLGNTVGGSLAAMATISPRFRVYGEVLASTSTGGGEGDTTLGTPVVPEAAGQELVGTIGLGVYVHPKWFLSLSVSYDNLHAILWRPGITFRSK